MIWVFLLMFGDITIADITEKSTTLETTVLMDDLPYRVSSIQYMKDKGLVLFAIGDKKIYLYDPGVGTIEEIAGPGQGPAEFDGGFLNGSVVGDKIVAMELSSHAIKEFSIGDKSFRKVITESEITSGFNGIMEFVKLDNDFVYAVSFASQFEDNNNMISIFRVKENGSWEQHGSFLEEESMDDFEADRAYRIKTKMMRAGSSNFFYRVPTWASPIYQVFDQQGNINEEFPIPHPRAHRLSKDPAIKFQKYKEKRRQTLVRSVCVDESGTLHFLLEAVFSEADENLSRKVIVRVNKRGVRTGIFTADRHLDLLAVTPDGSRYYAWLVDDESLIQLSPKSN